MATNAKTATKKIAKEGVETVRSVTADALGAAASAVAGVVLTRVAEGLGAGSKKIEETTPEVQQAANRAVKRRVSTKTLSRQSKAAKTSKKKPAKKKKAFKTTTSRRKKR